MKNALLAIALLGLFLNGFLFRRLLTLLIESMPLPAVVRPRPATLVPDEGFFLRFLAPAAPIIGPSLVAFPLFWFAQTWEEVVLGLLIISVIIALGTPLLAPELTLWSHRATRLVPEQEAALLASVHRLGLRPSEVWVSQTPVVAFWEPSVHVPALLLGSRVLIWEHVRGLPGGRLAGVALGHRAAFWPWGLWPVAAAAGMHALDSTSVLPLWLFAVPIALVCAGALPELSKSLAVHRRIRSDAAIPEVIRGFLEIELACAAFIAGRGAGPYHRLTAWLAWTTAVRRARRAAHLAGLKPAILDAAVDEAAASPLAELAQ